ncbi:MAG: hypothetical protein IPI83_07430 [Sphingomonadales bacterium]|nr:hypothetical protein [Sphingomonadales bacterium]MBK7284215.1 hypothetical protein [Sphingomonadales bacterium]
MNLWVQVNQALVEIDPVPSQIEDCGWLGEREQAQQHIEAGARRRPKLRSAV